jgi:hypothetical protein
MTSGAADPSPPLCHANTKWSRASQGRCAAAIANPHIALYRQDGRTPRHLGAMPHLNVLLHGVARAVVVSRHGATTTEG